MSASPRNRILLGDARDQLQHLPGNSVDQVITSPPYLLLRDYGVAGQLGMESHVDDWVKSLVAVADELARVLTPTGSLWLNVSDTYATHRSQGAERKSLLLGPERLALELVEGGWCLRNKLIWQKANPMPTSVTDRLACSWEAIYVFTRSPRYFFDLDSIREPHLSHPSRRAVATIAAPVEGWRGPNAGNSRGLAAVKAQGRVGHPLGKNPGDVWRFPASNFRGGHHATFPVGLIERMIRAGCPEQRCSRCRKPWRRPVHRDPKVVRPETAPSCSCATMTEPGLVLDPFMGSGTTGVAAERLSRDWLGIELNPRFAAMARHRIITARLDPRAVAHAPPLAA